MDQIPNLDQLITSLSTDWKTVLKEIGKDENKTEINELISKHGSSLYPPTNKIFNAFSFFNIKDTKVVILGQDPYHTPNKAMGLSFSVPKGETIPPSLRNIYKELKNDKFTINDPKNGDLTKWAKNGVLLLNSSLTVLEKSPNCHQSIWMGFTDKIIEYIANNTENVVFMLWGGFARGKKKYIPKGNHLVLESTHPSPLSANRGGWFNKQPFIKANIYLKSCGREEIDWNL